MSKGIKITGSVILFIVLMAWVTAPALLSNTPAGSHEDPLISLSYLETVVGGLTEQIEQLSTKITQLQNRVAELEANEPPDQPAPPSEPEPPKPEPSTPMTVIVNTTGSVNFRPEPNTNNTPLTRVYNGDMITVLRVDGDWYQGKLGNGLTGWISAPLTKPQTNHVLGVILGNLVNVRTGPGTNYPRLADRVAKDEAVRILKQQGDWYNVVVADGKIGWIHVPLVEKH